MYSLDVVYPSVFHSLYSSNDEEMVYFYPYFEPCRNICDHMETDLLFAITNEHSRM